MQTQEVAIKPNLRVVLKSDAEVLDEVVVTAMGIKRSEKALGYSATSVNSERITETRTSDIMSSLSGKIAGVQISNTSSDPGASNSVIIRGVSSLSGSNQPLYVVDGVPLNNSAVYSTDGLNSGYDFGNGANAVNPDDVESMTILKGAAATALYGSRAASGVVMITTKTGKKNKGLGIEYNGGLQWSTILRLPEFQNEFGMGWNGDHTELENGSWGPRFDGSMQLWGNKVTTKKRNAERYSDRIELQGFQSCFRLFVKPSQSPLKPNQDAATLLVRNHARNGDKRTRITKQGVKD